MVDQTMPFASALFDLGNEEHKEEQLLHELKDVRDVLCADGQYLQALGHPKILRQTKKDWMDELFARQCDPLIINWLKVLADYNLLARIEELYQDYLQLYRESRNIEVVQVASAAELDAKQIEKLKKMLEEKLQKHVELSIKVEPALIAGLRIQSKDFTLDNSMASRLNSMKEKLNS